MSLKNNGRPCDYQRRKEVEILVYQTRAKHCMTQMGTETLKK